MAHKVITPPTVEPVLLAEAKEHLRLDSAAHPDDALVGRLISAARDYCEIYTGLSLATATWETAQDYFPYGAIELDGSVVSITSVKYVDANQVEQTMDVNAYVIDNYSIPNWLIPAVDTDWPATYAAANAMKVRYVVGGTLTPTMRAALLLMLGHLYESREAVVTGIALAELPLGVAALLSPHRITMGV